MTQFIHPTLEVAIANIDADTPTIAYFDNELGGVGVYTVAELDGPGAWVRGDMIVWDSREDTREIALPQER